MRVIGIGCVRNEEDIIEAFVRHTLAYCRDLILIVNGSTDATPDILQRLKAEGLALHLIHDPTIGNVQVDHMNRLMRLAVSDFSADWIISVDADEFIAGQPDSAALLPEPAGENTHCLKIPLRSYYTSPEDPPGILNPVERITKRLLLEPWATTDMNPCVYKVIVPGCLARLPRSYISQGNHLFYIDGREAPFHILENAWLAHYSLRSPRQYAMKAAVRHFQKFRLIPSKGDETPFYERVYEEVRESYTAFIKDFCRQHIPYLPPHDTSQVVSEPLVYLGGPLRYTAPQPDEIDLFVRQLLDFTETLALAGVNNGDAAAGEQMEAAPKLVFEVSNNPVRRSGQVYVVEASPTIKHALYCALDFPLRDREIYLHFHSEPGMIEISEITVIHPGRGTEQTFGFEELNGMLRVVSNAAAIYCDHIYRMLVSRDPVTVVFRGWGRPGEAAPSALRIKLRYENRLVPGAVLCDSVLNTITTNFNEVERLSPKNSMGNLPDCTDFPINFTSHGNAFCFIGEGWGHAEPWGMWTVGGQSTLKLHFEKLPARNLELSAHIRPFALVNGRKLRLRVHVDDEPLATWTLGSSKFKQFSVKIPANKIKSHECKIRFDIDSPVSPKEINSSSTDFRKLGAGFKSVNIRSARRLLL